MIDRFLTRIANARSFAGQAVGAGAALLVRRGAPDGSACWGSRVSGQGVLDRARPARRHRRPERPHRLHLQAHQLLERPLLQRPAGRNAEAFWAELDYWVVLVALFIVAVVYRLWLMQLLTIRWRRWLSQVYFRDWLADRTYYHMELTRRGIGNPEQRIEQDCNSFTSQTLEHLARPAPADDDAHHLHGRAVEPLERLRAAAVRRDHVPGYMMWAAIAYALVGSWATYLIGRPLVRINFALERYNADFRYRMVRIRENAESIALYHGEPVEERRLQRRLHPHLRHLVGLHEVQQAADLAHLVLRPGGHRSFPIIVAAPQYFAGQIGLGTLTQTADAFGQVQGSLSWFVDSYTQLAAWKAVVDRLTTFGEAMVAAKRAAEQSAIRHPPAGQSPSWRSTAWTSPARWHAAAARHQPRGAPAARRWCCAGLRAAARPRCFARWRAYGRSGADASPRRWRTPRAVPAAEALSAHRHAQGRAVLSRPVRPVRRQRMPRGAGGVRAVAPVAPAQRGRQLVAGALGRRAAAPRLRPRARLPPGLAVPRRGHLRARRARREAHVRAPPASACPAPP